MKRTKNTVARRSFIKGAVAATGVAAGCSTLGAAAALADEQAWDEEFDIVVVGAGAAGSVAALTVATEGNGESCLLLEKGEVPSGCTPYAGGRSLWTNDAEAMKKYLKGMSEGVTPDDILDVFAEGMTGILDWLVLHRRQRGRPDPRPAGHRGCVPHA